VAEKKRMHAHRKIHREEMFMRRKLMWSATAAMAAVLAGAGGVTAKELVYGSGIPAKSDQMVLGLHTYADDLAKASNGALTMKILAGSQVVSLYNTLKALRDGTIDAGFIVPTFTRKELKHVNVIYDTEVFGLDSAAVTGAANETMLLDCPTCLKDFRDNKSVYLASFGNNQKGLICRNPVTKVEDVKGLKIRAVGATTRLIQELGGVPVVMGPPDATTAMERGTIDCVHGVVTWLKNFGYWDVAKYMLETPMGSPRTISSIVYARRTWDKMTPAEKKAAMDAVPMHLARMVYEVNVKADGKIKETAVKEKGVKFTEGGKDFVEFMEKFRAQEQTRIPKLAKEKLGTENADQIFATFQKNLVKWEKIAKEKDLANNPKLMAETFKKEIYDKVDLSKL
jgi:TRAP-type C4-dicarboxylate transport system substrate-binding protein